MSLDSLRSVCSSTFAIAGQDEEGGPLTLFVLPVSDHDTIVAEADTVNGEATIRSFTLAFAAPRTAEGIGVGSRFHDIKSTYHQLEAGDNEGAVYVWGVPDDGVSFKLSTSRDLLHAGWQENPSLIPDTARVIEVLIRRVEHGR